MYVDKFNCLLVELNDGPICTKMIFFLIHIVYSINTHIIEYIFGLCHCGYTFKFKILISI